MSLPNRWRTSRLIRFQLTSMMDLLLIIVFAQYLEFHVSQDKTWQDSKVEIEIARQAWQREMNETTQQLNELRDRFSRDKKELQLERDASIARAVEADRRSELTEKLIKRLSKFDEKIVDAERSPTDSKETMADAAALSSRIAEMEPSEVLRFLVSYDELLKRADIWTIHVSDRGTVEFMTEVGSAATDFRLEGSTQKSRKESFVLRMRTHYMQISEPPGTVIILVSYSPRAIAGNYQPVLDGLPELVDTLAADFGGRTRFEFSVVGAMFDPAHDLPR